MQGPMNHNSRVHSKSSGRTDTLTSPHPHTRWLRPLTPSGFPVLQVGVAAVQEDRQASGAGGSEELGNDVDERDADIADKDDGGANGTRGVQAGTSVGPTGDGSGVQREANGKGSGVAVAGLKGQHKR